ncbi:hypothetical protein EW093_06810 [Thiospirochaeta perfilievii]|uniref:Endo-1,3-beta-glucanase btgC n=1 Tax=Thiospirochaeta perfilievii TaxID=252967 RepID=A0A5C1QAP9_9SPIO|nr:glycosyl hydrolase family 17 protein [Thiospirochaeta perfilievii]QEN04418.1 hypothetical protein EW093_06810 [Thiospirochaeta perfilievii]
MKLHKKLIISFTFLFTLLFTGCDFLGENVPGNGTIPTTSIVDALPSETVTTLRALPDDFTTRKAISYSGYREGQSPDTKIYPTTDQILEDLQMLESMGLTLIRLYDTSTHAERVLEVIKTNNLDMKVMLGVWIAGATEAEDLINIENLDKAVTLANGEYSDTVLAISVGNECMVDWNTFGHAVPAAHVAGYATYIRSKVTQPITVDDNWEPWSMKDESNTVGPYADVELVIKAVDFLAIHTYPIFDAEHGLWDHVLEDTPEAERADAMMNAAIDYAEKNYDAVKNNIVSLGFDKPIVIGESGWQDSGDAENIGHQVNQAMYYEKMNQWLETDIDSPVTCFFFEAFDEPWKSSDDHWGFFNVNREAKYIVSSNATWSTLEFTTDANSYTDSDAVYVIPVDLDPIYTVTDSIFIVMGEDLSVGYNGQLAGEENNLQWESWENNSTAGFDDYLAGDGQETGGDNDFIAPIQPTPESWGWGMMALMKKQGMDLSAFSNGHLTFSIKTTYSGNIEIGCQTGYGADGDSWDLIKTVDPTNNSYGYLNDGQWHEVSIPISDLVAIGSHSFGNTGGTINLGKVYIPFVIGDRDGNPDTAVVNVDKIRWTQN